MSRLPAIITPPDSSRKVEHQIARLLKAAGVGQRLPTPQADILACAELVQAGALDLAEYERTLSDKGKALLRSAFSKIIGVLDFHTKTVFVDPTLSDIRKTFVLYHEVAHKVLPWQAALFMSDDDANLADDVSNKFEAEANYGSAEIIFQNDRFEKEAADFKTEIGGALFLAEKYGASIHSTLRRFVERNKRPAMLLVLTQTRRVHENGKCSYYVKYPIFSQRFSAEFGDPFPRAFLEPDEPISTILHQGPGTSGEITLTNLTGFPKKCIVEVFSNHYSLFALIHPQGFQWGRGVKVVVAGQDSI